MLPPRKGSYDCSGNDAGGAAGSLDRGASNRPISDTGDIYVSMRRLRRRVELADRPARAQGTPALPGMPSSLAPAQGTAGGLPVLREAGLPVATAPARVHAVWPLRRRVQVQPAPGIGCLAPRGAKLQPQAHRCRRSPGRLFDCDGVRTARFADVDSVTSPAGEVRR